MLILCAIVVPSFLITALVGCLTGGARMAYDAIRDAEAVPQELKDWMEGVIPHAKAQPDPGMFPTK